MNLKDQRERAYWAGEVAALASDGHSTEEIWMRLDITRGEVEQLYQAAEFEEIFRKKYGDDVFQAWALSRAESRQRHSIVTKIVDRSDEYYEELHKIAMNPETKDDARTKILMEFLTTAKQLGTETTAERVELKPSTVKHINRGLEILSRHNMNYSLSSPRDAEEDVFNNKPQE